MRINNKFRMVEAVLLTILQYCTSSIGAVAIVGRLRGKDLVLSDFYYGLILGIIISVVLSIDIYRKSRISSSKQDGLLKQSCYLQTSLDSSESFHINRSTQKKIGILHLGRSYEEEKIHREPFYSASMKGTTWFLSHIPSYPHGSS